MINSSRKSLSSNKSKINSTAQPKDLNPTSHYSSVRLQIDRNTSEKIAALRFDAQQRGEDNFSLSAVVEDAIEMYCECVFEGREIPTPVQYAKFLKSI
jgi:hypothetical protein